MLHRHFHLAKVLFAKVLTHIPILSFYALEIVHTILLLLLLLPMLILWGKQPLSVGPTWWNVHRWRRQQPEQQHNIFLLITASARTHTYIYNHSYVSVLSSIENIAIYCLLIGVGVCLHYIIGNFQDFSNWCD